MAQRRPDGKDSRGVRNSSLQDTGPGASIIADRPAAGGFSSLQDADLGRDEPHDRLVIAFDLNMTSNAISYKFTDSGESDPHLIIDWPGDSRHKPRVPSVISYDEKDKGSFRWGYEVHMNNTFKNMNPFLGFDYYQPSVHTSQYSNFIHYKKCLVAAGMSPVDVMADFLGAMRIHAIRQLESSFLAAYVEMNRKEYVITIPLVFSDKSKAALLNAAKKAGIWPVVLIKEPEASVTYNLYKMNGEITIGDALVICDIGSDRADLISYEVTQNAPLELKELVPNTWGLAGHQMLNKRFEDKLKLVLGEEEYFVLRKKEEFNHAMRDFDEIKNRYRGEEAKEYYIYFPMAKLADDPKKNIEADMWKITSQDIREIFEPVISYVEALVQQQIDKVIVKRMSEDYSKRKEVKAIFLAGEFSSSEYLRSRLVARFPGVLVVHTAEPWAALASGAVLSQFPLVNSSVEITSTVAVRHYGVATMFKYDEKIDRGQPKVWSPRLAEYRVARMVWYINMGEELSQDTVVRIPFTQHLPKGYGQRDLVFKNYLLQSEEITPPVHPGPETKTNCMLKVDLTGLERSFKRIISSDREEYFEQKYNLLVRTKAASMEFALEVDDKEIEVIAPSYF